MTTHPKPQLHERPRRILKPSKYKPKTPYEKFQADILGEVDTAVELGPVRVDERDYADDIISLLTRAVLLRITACRAIGVSLTHWSAGRLLEEECVMSGLRPRSVAWSQTRAEVLVSAALAKPVAGHQPCPACDGTGEGHSSACCMCL